MFKIYQLFLTMAAALLVSAAIPVSAFADSTTTIYGTLGKTGSTYLVDGQELGFGPLRYINVNIADSDYDGDGDIELIVEELDGLLGASVTIYGKYSRGGETDVYKLNGLDYRSPGRPAWAGGPHRRGRGKPSWTGGPPPWALGHHEGRRPRNAAPAQRTRQGTALIAPSAAGDGATNTELALSLPFNDAWYVSQGNNDASPTHKGLLAYSWDFIMVDEGGSSHRGNGTSVEDYFAWAQPVVAPAPGQVVAVVNNVPDNAVGEVNNRERWGNYIIIAHGSGAYGLIAHLQRGSIVVKKGERVGGGELLGYVGNSGYSLEPHIHFQVQRDSGPKARTIPSNFSTYYDKTPNGEIVVELGVPRRGDIVRNP